MTARVRPPARPAPPAIVPTNDKRFGPAYYRRFYRDAGQAVTSRMEMRARGRMIAGFVDYCEMPVRRILDAGCGLGLLRPSLKRAFPNADYVGLEASPYLCRKYGWHRGSLATWKSRHTYELAICYDVMQYLGDRDATRALANLGRLARGILYFSALTEEDWRFIADRGRTDRDVALRPADWYRARLARNFHEVGVGLWLRRGAQAVLWSLEAHGRVLARRA